MTLVSLTPQAAIPSPTTAIWHLGPVPIRAYALCMVLGIVVACVVTEARLRRRGVHPWAVLDIAVWAVPFGIVGARIYHVITSPDKYFGADGDPIKVFYVWEGGLGIWGAVAGGALGAWLAARQIGIPFGLVADALAPGLPLAQAVGRVGNWFNNELYGGPTTLPWGLEVHRMNPENPGQANLVNGEPERLAGLYHPTFAYEALWNIGVAVLVFLVDRRLKLGRGRAFALYVMGYTAGRFWVEMMRTDPATEIMGVRLNVFTAALVFVGALVYFLRVRGPREYVVPVDGAPAVAEPSASGVSQVDVSGTAARSTTEPEGYRAVTEEEYRTYRETGQVPADPAPDTAAKDGEAASGGDLRGDEADEPDDTADDDAGGRDEDDDEDDDGEPDDAVDDDQARAAARSADDR